MTGAQHEIENHTRRGTRGVPASRFVGAGEGVGDAGGRVILMELSSALECFNALRLITFGIDRVRRMCNQSLSGDNGEPGLNILSSFSRMLCSKVLLS